MEIYSTEEQQAEAIKGFFRENGLAIGVGVVVGLSALYGWKYYNNSVIESTSLTSDAYTKLVEKAGQKDSTLVADSDTFIKENTSSSYAVLAAFVAAKEAVDASKLDIAAQKLSWISENATSSEFKAIALTRLARIQLELKEFEKALASLNKEMPKSFSANVEEIKGDVYLAQGEKEQARAAYEKAVDAGGLENNATLQIKLDNLAVGTPAV